MLKDQVAYLLQRYLGNYVRGLSAEALKISVWQGDVELTNMQLKPEALNSLNLPVRVKAGFLGSVKLKVPWSRLGQEPVQVYLDRIFILAEPATQVVGCSEDAIFEAKRIKVREMERKLLEAKQQQNSEVNATWLGSLINTIIGNLKLSITNIHIRYEDLESNPGHPCAAGITLSKLSAVTVDENGNETFATGGALESMQKSVELDRLAFYFDSDTSPWTLDKSWEDMSPSQWSQIFEFGTKDASSPSHEKEHSYILQPVSGSAKYSKRRADESRNSHQPLQRATVYLDDVVLCLSKDEYHDVLKIADNFSAFNKRLKYAHYRPLVGIKSNPRIWWRYAFRVVIDQCRRASGKMSWDQVLRYAKFLKQYVALYASLLRSDTTRPLIDDNKKIEELDRQLDVEVILQWRMMAHKFVEQSMESGNQKKQNAKKSWWSLGRGGQSTKDEDWRFSEEDWEQLNKILGYKENENEQLMEAKGNMLQALLEVHMKRNASKLLLDNQKFLAELSCDALNCSIRVYEETKVFDVKLASYRLNSPNGLLAESAERDESLVATFTYMPMDMQVDWSFVGKASPCYVTYSRDSVDQIVNFFSSSADISQTITLETATAVQMTIDGVKRTAQKQISRALKDRTRFFLDLDIAAPKVTIPTAFYPEGLQATKLLLDLGHFTLRSEDPGDSSLMEEELYVKFGLELKDVSAFLVDGDFCWNQRSSLLSGSSSQQNPNSYLPVLDKCGVLVKFQQIWMEHPLHPSTRISARLPVLGVHFSPARYHRLMQVMKIFQYDSPGSLSTSYPWKHADFEGFLLSLAWKGVGNREPVWQKRYFCLVGPFLYILENQSSTSYKESISLYGKQVLPVTPEYIGNENHVLAICDARLSNMKVLDLFNVLVIRFDNEESKKGWMTHLQGAIYRASASSSISTTLSEMPMGSGSLSMMSTEDTNANDSMRIEKVFLTGALDELKIYFSGSQTNKSVKDILLTKESRIFEFRAIGGQVEILIRMDDMLIGTVLRSMEIEDMYGFQKGSSPCYIVRSVIEDMGYESVNAASLHSDVELSEINQTKNENDEFFEASEDLVDDCPRSSGNGAAQFMGEYSNFSKDPPCFNRIPGLLPYDTHDEKNGITLTDTSENFVKAQIIIRDMNSPLYANLDKEVIISLATLSFFCYRPTILAILDFVNAINCEDSSNFSSFKSYADEQTNDKADPIESMEFDVQEPIAKGLLRNEKSRVIFSLSLNMTNAWIYLMKENGVPLATLSQNNLQTHIKVFQYSFSVKASLGNLKISDNSLLPSHDYFWVCDMRDPIGSSFVELEFSSFSVDDENYDGYDYSLVGKLSEVRIVYLNRFIQEVTSYFTGLVPSDSTTAIKLKDQVTNTEKWFTTNELEGSSAIKLDLSLQKPIILMPRETNSHDFLQLDVPCITVQNEFHWYHGDKNDVGAVRLEILTLEIKGINLAVGTGKISGENIVKDIKGISIVVRRSLRDLVHQLPDAEVSIKMEELKAALSNMEYNIILECASSNISETPNLVPALGHSSAQTDMAFEQNIMDMSSVGRSSSQVQNEWTSMKISVSVGFVELCLHSGSSTDVALATFQINGAFLIYQSRVSGRSAVSATLKRFAVIDDRAGTKEEFKLAIGGSDMMQSKVAKLVQDPSGKSKSSSVNRISDNISVPIPTLTMLILDVNFRESVTAVSLCIQRPHMLVALDFLLALVEFFVPDIFSGVSSEDAGSSDMVGAIILDQPIYCQPCEDFTLSPQRSLVADDERFDHYIYDGKGGSLSLMDRNGSNLSEPSHEPIIFVGNGKLLQFKNVTIKNSEYMDSCLLLGTSSRYSVSPEDNVHLQKAVFAAENNSTGVEHHALASVERNISATEFIIELQVIGPELTFYTTSKAVGELSTLPTKLLHMQLDLFSRVILRNAEIEMNASAIGLTMESNGMRIIEPFNSTGTFSKASDKTNISLSVSDIVMNFSFSILQLFLGVEEDIMAFLRMSKEITVECSQFDRVGVVHDQQRHQTYAFWRPRAPPGFAVLCDCLTPLDEPPTKGVIAVNTNFARVKRPLSFKFLWSSVQSDDLFQSQSLRTHGADKESISQTDDSVEIENICSIWLPVAPPGYVALGCIASSGKSQPSLSSVLCVMEKLVSTCGFKDCIMFTSLLSQTSIQALWRVDNTVGSFLPEDSITKTLVGKPYEFRHMVFRKRADSSVSVSRHQEQNTLPVGDAYTSLSQRLPSLSSPRRFELISRFNLIWWNVDSTARKKLSIWRPIVPQGLVFFGDTAIQGSHPPSTAISFHDDDTLLKVPMGYQLVGHIKKQKGLENISFWLPQAPPGYVSLGCVASKVPPRSEDFQSLRCIRSDMVTGDQFPDQSVWDTSELKYMSEVFSLWALRNEVGTFFVRNGLRKPPKRFAVRLVVHKESNLSDDFVVEAEVKAFSITLFDNCGGMVPLFNLSLHSISANVCCKSDTLNSSVSFSSIVKSFNDKYDCWEPFVEQLDGVIRYQYDMSANSRSSQLRIISTSDLKVNVSVSNTNLILQAYASWSRLSQVHETHKMERQDPSNFYGGYILDMQHRRNYYIVPQNNLGHDIFLRSTQMEGITNIVKLQPGMPLMVPVSKDMLSSHIKVANSGTSRKMVVVVIADGELPCDDVINTHQYIVSIRISPTNVKPGWMMQQQMAHTCFTDSEYNSAGCVLVNWGEIFFFKVDAVDCCIVDLSVTDLGKGVPVGTYSAPLMQMSGLTSADPTSSKSGHGLSWIELYTPNRNENVMHVKGTEKLCGRLRCGVFCFSTSDGENEEQAFTKCMQPGSLQISPGKDGPWTALRLNYAANAAAWRLGNDVVVSEVTLKEGNRHVDIRSLVRVVNNTDYAVDLALLAKDYNSIEPLGHHKVVEGREILTEEFCEIQIFDPQNGWVASCSHDSSSSSRPHKNGDSSHKALPDIELPSGWLWTEDWHVDISSVNTADGWVYSSDLAHFKWPYSFSHESSLQHVRQRKWIRNRKKVPDAAKKRIIGLLKPGETIPLPLSCITRPGTLMVLPKLPIDSGEYSWSSFSERFIQSVGDGYPEEVSQFCLSSLVDAEDLLQCPMISGSSSEDSSDLWFCLSTQSTDIGKDIHSELIFDWKLVLQAPLSFVNFLPLVAEFSITERQLNGALVIRSQGILHPGETANVYNADMHNPLYLSLFVQGGWKPLDEVVLISHPEQKPTKTFSLRSLYTERVVDIILDEKLSMGQLVPKVVSIYAPYWVDCTRCPPLTCKLVNLPIRRGHYASHFLSDEAKGNIVSQINMQEIVEGYTIISMIDFRNMGLSVAISDPREQVYGPVSELSPLGGLDGSVVIKAYNSSLNCIPLFVSVKPCPHQSVPTKVISVRPFMTFTNRYGQDIYVKMSAEDEPKILHACDARVSFAYRRESGKLQVRLENSDWCYPLEIQKEDNITLGLRMCNGEMRFLKTEIRGYEEGSRFLVVFRLGSTNGPIRIENRTPQKILSVRQSGLGDDAWILLQPLSTTKFAWQDPCRQKLLDVKIFSEGTVSFHKYNLQNPQSCISCDWDACCLHVLVADIADFKVVRFIDRIQVGNEVTEADRSSVEIYCQNNKQFQACPLELTVEFGVLGVSVIDQKPREVLYMYLERVYVSYFTGFDSGKSSRFKLLVGYLQFDNQIPLTIMPVLLAPEQTSDANQPVFKMTITMCNNNPDGLLVFPCVYVRVTEKCWRISVHEPIIWALVDFYKNLSLDSIPGRSNVTNVDPELQIDLVDISEVRLKLALEPAPTQRPPGILGMWSPILSAFGNAFKIQIHVRKVMRRNRILRQSSVFNAILNRVWRDLIHNPLHLVFAVDVLGMTSSTLSTLSKGFAELSTDGQFQQRRSKQESSRRITGVRDGILRGTEALAQGVAFGVSGVVTKPVENARQHGVLGFAQGVGQAFLGIFAQPVSGALDFFSLTVDGIGATCAKLMGIFSSSVTVQRVRNPRVIRAHSGLREYSEREAIGQMVLYLAEESRHLGCTEILKEPSKFAWTDFYEDHFMLPHGRILLITNKRVIMLQCIAPHKLDKKPCKVLWELPFEELLTLELAKVGYEKPTHLILHIKVFRRSQNFVYVVKCEANEESDRETEATHICLTVRKAWKAYLSRIKSLRLKVPTLKQYVYFPYDDPDESTPRGDIKPLVRMGESSSMDFMPRDKSQFYTVNFAKVWSSEQKIRFVLCPKQVGDDAEICSIWSPICPEGFVSVGDIARIGRYPPNVATVYQNVGGRFALPVGYDLVWRNCPDDYITRVSVWYPRPPEGFVSIGCVAVADYAEPKPDAAYCVHESLLEDAQFEEESIWRTPNPYPWACYFYQVQSGSLQFVALRQTQENLKWRARRVQPCQTPKQTQD